MALMTKEYDLKFTFDGHPVEATIHYTAKDYRIEVHKPCPVTLDGRNIVAMLPVVYVVELSTHPKYKEVDLNEQCIRDIERFLSVPMNHPSDGMAEDWSEDD
jgi:hypothetical protein